MNQVRADFEHLYEGILPPVLRDTLTGQDRATFLSARFHSIHQMGDSPLIQVSTRSGLWDASSIEAAMPDLPFIADTILGLIDSMGLTIRFRVLALFDVRRTRTGTILDVRVPAADLRKRAPGFRRESWIFIALDPIDGATAGKALARLQRNLRDLHRMVEDHERQIAFLSRTEFQNPALGEQALWLFENFILMGTAQTKREKDRPSLSGCLGMLRDRGLREDFIAWLPRFFPDRQSPTGSGIGAREEALLVLETTLRSGVKQDKPLHCLVFLSSKEIRVAIGSFAGRGEITPRFLIPALRSRLEEIASNFAAPEGSHTRRQLFRLAQLIPLGLLFSRGDSMVQSWLRFMLDQRHSRETAHIFLIDEDCGGCWILRTVLEEDSIAHALPAFAAEHGIEVATNFRRDGDGLSLHFLWLRSSRLSPTEILTLLQKNEETLLLSWTERFRRACNHRLTGQDISKRTENYLRSLDEASSVHLSPRQTLDGILLLESVRDGHRVRIEPTGWNREPAIHVYTRQERLLGDLTPALDSCGLRVHRGLQLSFKLEGGAGHRHIFYLADAPAEERIQDLESIVEGILNGLTTADRLNQLARSPGFTLQGIRLLKALVACLYQLDRSFSILYLDDVLVRHADFARALTALVNTGFAEQPDDKKRLAALKQLDDLIGQLRTVPERTTGQHLRDLAAALLRCDLTSERPVVAFKIDTPSLTFAPEPRPLYEIFVHGAGFEGVHLRAGPVSRGGIRWSDRTDDFRQEILGLMATQQIKNTMIVPDGSKGGFVLHRHGSNGTANQSELALGAYKEFIEALLRLTDNLDAKGKPAHPRNMVCRDGFDPYLVVAADRGTSTFSDTANAIAAQRGFWLGDGFASGGRFGYDHKKQGITAKGAWESVKSHFAQMGINPEKDPIRIIAIGDMSGDVCGNGLLLSRSARVVAAFNHRFIFIDPEPDVARSFAERQRLFRKGLDWDAFNRAILSPGGGIYEREAADIPVTQAIKRMLDIEQETISGPEMVQAILMCRADLLWNGGIGTYVKSSIERQEEAGDPTNDAVRVNGSDLRVSVVAEGGNLGFTMQGRYEAALHGVRLHTDAVDNSAGVDMSDHEVNLKILLQSLIHKKKIRSLEDRNALIRRLEPTMIRQVLANNASINRAVALEQARCAAEPWMLRLWLQTLLEGGALTDREVPLQIMEWHRSGRYPGPFIGNIIGWTKMYYRARFALSPESHPELQDLLFSRFRDIAVPGIRDAILEHPLAEPIVRTEAINRVIHTAGTFLLFRLARIRGLDETKALTFWFELERHIQAEELRKAIETRLPSPAERMQAHLELDEALLRIALWIPPSSVVQTSPARATGRTGDLRIHIRALPDMYRFAVYQIPLRAQHRLANHAIRLAFDELESTIRRTPCLDSRELAFQGRLLSLLENMRRDWMQTGGEGSTAQILEDRIQEIAHWMGEKKASPTVLYEILNAR